MNVIFYLAVLILSSFKVSAQFLPSKVERIEIWFEDAGYYKISINKYNNIEAKYSIRKENGDIDFFELETIGSRQLCSQLFNTELFDEISKMKDQEGEKVDGVRYVITLYANKGRLKLLRFTQGYENIFIEKFRSKIDRVYSHLQNFKKMELEKGEEIMDPPK
jgi:hypothetical protein